MWIGNLPPPYPTREATKSLTSQMPPSAAPETDKATEKELQRLRRLPENRVCPNCLKEDRLGFTAVCVAFKTFVCSDCKSAHQSFSHRTKSVTMSVWTMSEVKALDESQGGGNKVALRRYLANVPEGARPAKDSSLDAFKKFVELAYNEQRWADANFNLEDLTRENSTLAPSSVDSPLVKPSPERSEKHRRREGKEGRRKHRLSDSISGSDEAWQNVGFSLQNESPGSSVWATPQSAHLEALNWDLAPSLDAPARFVSAASMSVGSSCPSPASRGLECGSTLNPSLACTSTSLWRRSQLATNPWMPPIDSTNPWADAVLPPRSGAEDRRTCSDMAGLYNRNLGNSPPQRPLGSAGWHEVY